MARAITEFKYMLRNSSDSILQDNWGKENFSTTEDNREGSKSIENASKLYV